MIEKQTRRRYSEEFKAKAVELVESQTVTAELESKLRIAKRELRLNAKRLEQARDAMDTSHEKAIGLYSEAKAVGVIDGTDSEINADKIIEALQAALWWNLEKIPEDDGSRISQLEEELDQLRKDRREVQARIDAAHQFSKRAGGYESEATGQLDRLASIKALPKNPNTGEWQWPFSEQNLALESPIAKVLL